MGARADKATEMYVFIFGDGHVHHRGSVGIWQLTVVLIYIPNLIQELSFAHGWGQAVSALHAGTCHITPDFGEIKLRKVFFYIFFVG